MILLPRNHDHELLAICLGAVSTERNLILLWFGALFFRLNMSYGYLHLACEEVRVSGEEAVSQFGLL